MKGWRLFLIIVTMMIWVGSSIIASQLFIGYLMLGILGAEVFLQPLPTAIYSTLSYVVAMLLIIFIPPKIAEVSKKKKNKKSVASIDRKSLGLNDLPTWTYIGLAPAGFLVYLLLATGLTFVFQIFPWFNAGESQDIGFSLYLVGFDRMIAFLVLVVIAPIAEEMIFRGWLYDRMRREFLRKYSNTVSMILSILLVSILFGIVHMQWNVGVNVFAMSIVLCGLREITGTIYAGILMHMLKNGIAFYLLYVVGIA